MVIFKVFYSDKKLNILMYGTHRIQKLLTVKNGLDFGQTGRPIYLLKIY